MYALQWQQDLKLHRKYIHLMQFWKPVDSWCLIFSIPILLQQQRRPFQIWVLFGGGMLNKVIGIVQNQWHLYCSRIKRLHAVRYNYMLEWIEPPMRNAVKKGWLLFYMEWSHSTLLKKDCSSISLWINRSIQLNSFHIGHPKYFQSKNDWRNILLKKNVIMEIRLIQTGAHLFI